MTTVPLPGSAERTAPSGIRRVIAMEVVSGLGDGVFWVGLTAVLLDRGLGAAGFGVAAIARLGPRALISAPAGVLADRLDRRWLLVSLDLLRAAVLVMLAFAAASGVGPAGLLALVAVGYTLAAPYRPALTAALPLVAGEDGLALANAQVSTVRQVMTFVGPLIGAGLVAVWSPTAAFIVDAASFLVAAIVLASIRALSYRSAATPSKLAEQRHRWLRDLTTGWNDIRGTTGLSVITLLVFAMYVARGAELVLFIFVAEQQLDLGTAGIGILTGAVGLGAIAAVPAASRLARSDHATGAMAASLLTTAIPLAALAAIHSTPAACLVLTILGAGLVVFEVLSVLMLQRLARRDLLGRIFGVVGTASNAGKLLGAIVAPVLVACFGVSTALVSIAALVTVCAGAAAPGLRSVSLTARNRHDQLRPVVDVLSQLGIFDGASTAVLERVASSIRVEVMPGGTDVLSQGEPADDLYIVRTGQLAVLDEETTINTLDTDDWFGEIGLLLRQPRAATVRTSTSVELWRIPGPTFLTALRESAAEPVALFSVMADRLGRNVDPPEN